MRQRNADAWMPEINSHDQGTSTAVSTGFQGDETPSDKIGSMSHPLSVTGAPDSHGTLIRIADWEGLHCAEALTHGKPISGMWYDRALEYEIHRQAERKAVRNDAPVEPIKRGDFMTEEEKRRSLP